MRGSAQPAGAHNPLGTLLVNGPRSRGAWARGPRVGGEESPREPDGEDESLEEVCAPSLPPRGHPGQVFRRAPGPAPRRGLNCAERAAGGGGGGQKGSARGSLPNPQGRGEAELRDPPLPAGPGPPPSPAAANTAAGARGAGPSVENQTGLAASQPIREQTGRLRPMAAANANER